jgi:GNAT superfamily N-acetyltransferase
MEITSYNRQQLGELIGSDLFRNLDSIPISPHRALSHMHNPDCSDDDILLWVAAENGSLMGYVGVLPGVCSIRGASEKIYWLSCFWVDEQHRNTRLASSLFFPLVKLYRDRLFISSFVPSLEKTYQRLGIFHPTAFGTGTRFYMNFCFTDILPGRIPKGSFLKPVFMATDSILNFALSARDLFYKNIGRKLRVVENVDFDEEFQSFLDDLRKEKTFIKRGAEHFRWILEFPWILQGKQDQESLRYYFSSRSEQFEYCSIKVYNEENLAGYALLKTRDRALIISYLYALDEAVEDITAFILDKAYREKLKMITSFDERVTSSIRKHRGRYVISKEIRRPYVITKKIDIAASSFQEGDGDAVFT